MRVAAVPGVLMVAEWTNLAVILDHVGDGVTVQDRSGRMVYANAAAARSLGFASPAELMAATTDEVVARFTIFDEDGHRFPLDRLPGRRAMAGEQAPAVMVRSLVHATGEERWSMIRASPVRDDTGAVVSAVTVWQDATAQMRTEAAQRFLAEAGEALAASLDVEATLANVAQLAVPRLADWCAVSLVRDDGTVSQVAVAHVDPARVEWALRLQAQYPPDPDADDGLRQVVRTGEPVMVSEVTEEMLLASAADDEQLAILRRVGLTSVIIVPMIVRGRVLGAISFVSAESGHHFGERDLDLAQELARRAALAVDNARLYNAEHAARMASEEAQARFRILFEGVPDAILAVDAAGRCIDANPAATQLLGYDLDDLLSLRVSALIPDAALADSQFETTRETAGRVESEIRRQDGVLLPVEIWTRRLDLPTGPISLAVVRDITERVADDAIREEVLSAIAHDLRNPLGSIKLHAQGLLRMLRRGALLDQERIGASLTAIDTMSTRATFLLEDIVDVARARGGERLPFAPEPTELVALVTRCAEEAAAAAERVVRVQPAVGSLAVVGDPRGLERVILNLVSNALKYSPEGTEVRVEIGLAPENPTQAQVAVADEGVGIPAADLPRIFHRYQRGRNVSQISGTGLGLTSARQIVDRHGGTISLTSTEGDGTRVTVHLPLVPPAD